ncbi:MAG: hypothetical protein AAGA26_02775 [Pseudomonadota bacterium]
MIARPETASAMGAALDRLLQTGLPKALAREAEPVLDGHSGVIRIRRLAIDFGAADALDAPDLAARIAAHLLAALKTLLARGGEAIRSWPDPESFAADYLLMRLGHRPAPNWAFEDFAILEHLPAERAAAEMISARPAILRPMVMRFPGKAPEALLNTWPAGAQSALAIALLSPKLSGEERAALPGVFALIAGKGATLEHQTRAEDRLVSALSMTLRLIAVSAQRVPVRSLVYAAAAYIEARHRLGSSEENKNVTPPAEMRQGAEANALGETLNRVEENTPARRALLEALKRINQDPTDPIDPVKAQEHGADRAAQPVEPSPMRTRFAGLALLMPSIVSLNPTDALGQTGLAMAVWHCLDPDDWEAASQDPVLAKLYPTLPQDIDPDELQPDPPAALIHQLADEARPVFDAAPPDRRWTALLLGEFASRLYGLHASSHGYLRRQFLDQPGEISELSGLITCKLDPLPLGIVLQMAGFEQEPQRLPHRPPFRFAIDLGMRG